MSLKEDIEFHDNLAQKLLALSDEDFRKNEPALLRDKQIFLRQLGDISNKRILECGFGDGLLACYLASQGATVWAFDTSPKMVEVAKRRAGLWNVSNKIHFECNAFEEINYADGCFDIICGCMVLHHVDLRRAMEKIKRYLSPDGKAVFRETSSDNPLLMFLRRHVVGKFGIKRRSTPDEFPLSRKNFKEVEHLFARSCIYYPEMFLWRLVARIYSMPFLRLLPLKFKNIIYHICWQLDTASYYLCPCIRKFSFYCYISCRTENYKIPPSPMYKGKKNYSVIALLAFVILNLGLERKAPPQSGKIGVLVREFQMLLRDGKNNGHDVAEAEKLGKESREALAEGNPHRTEELLKEAISLLQKGAKISSAPQIAPFGKEDRGRGVFPSKDDAEESIKAGKYLGSPFGSFGPYQFKLDSRDVITKDKVDEYLSELGVKWVQEMPKNIDDIPKTINVYSRVGAEGGPPPNIDYQKYESGLQRLIAKHKSRIKYWEVYTEPGGLPPPKGWRGYPKEYAALLKKTYKIIKTECPDCQVVIGGMPGVGKNFSENEANAKFLKDILEAGAAGSFDVFAFKQHHFKAEDYLLLSNKLEVCGKILSSYGVDIKKIPVFLETATYAGSPGYSIGHPLSRLDLPVQTEVQQAAAMVKIFAYALAQGVDKIFWNEILERHNFGGSSMDCFNFYGLVNNPLNDGQSHRKLAFYTYKKMIEILEGAEWNNIKTVSEKNGVYIYKFTRQGQNIWIAWNDTHETKKAHISGIKLPKARTILVVPEGKSGLDVKNYASAFKETVVNADNGELTLDLSEVPVFVQELR
ncbi:MAG: methyltransferase domain-containing protein [Candidatus Schekmanbacteria bacterium]|nr:methyltransferase domain-containing protein [Candidatus Schekmanbacteria bacterium]